MITGDIRGDGHVTSENYFISDVPHLLHGVVIFSITFRIVKSKIISLRQLNISVIKLNLTKIMAGKESLESARSFTNREKNLTNDIQILSNVLLWPEPNPFGVPSITGCTG